MQRIPLWVWLLTANNVLMLGSLNTIWTYKLVRAFLGKTRHPQHPGININAFTVA